MMAALAAEVVLVDHVCDHTQSHQLGSDFHCLRPRRCKAFADEHVDRFFGQEALLEDAQAPAAILHLDFFA